MPPTVLLPSPPGLARAPRSLPRDCRHAFDRERFERRVRPFLPRVLDAARRVCRDRDLASDALQDALIDLWHECELPEDICAWLVRAVVKRALCAARGERRRARRERCACGARAELALELDPARLAVEREERGLFAQALASLPGEQRAVFLLRESRGLDYGAIARALTLPLGTVRSRLSRARRGLRTELEARGALEPRSTRGAPTAP